MIWWWLDPAPPPAHTGPPRIGYQLGYVSLPLILYRCTWQGCGC